MVTIVVNKEKRDIPCLVSMPLMDNKFTNQKPFLYSQNSRYSQNLSEDNWQKTHPFLHIF